MRNVVFHGVLYIFGSNKTKQRWCINSCVLVLSLCYWLHSLGDFVHFRPLLPALWAAAVWVLCGTLSVRHWRKSPSRPARTWGDWHRPRLPLLSSSLRWTELSDCSSGRTDEEHWRTVAAGPRVTEAERRCRFSRPVGKSITKQFGDGGTANEHKWCVVTQQGPVDKERRVQPGLEKEGRRFWGPANTRLSSVKVKATPPPLLLRTCMRPPWQKTKHSCSRRLSRKSASPGRAAGSYKAKAVCVFPFFSAKLK